MGSKKLEVAAFASPPSTAEDWKAAAVASTET
jgi:hypothetical protein